MSVPEWAKGTSEETYEMCKRNFFNEERWWRLEQSNAITREHLPVIEEVFQRYLTIDLINSPFTQDQIAKALLWLESLSKSEGEDAT